MSVENSIQNLTSENIDKQESLSYSRLIKLEPDSKFNDSYGLYGFSPLNIESKPKTNLQELFCWVKSVLNRENCTDVSNKKSLFDSNVTIWIHNKIVMDGSFLQYSEDKDITIKALYRESVASWRSDYDNESFLMQGVFLIEKDDLKFVHCALFHKGNQFEDEVSFFNVVMDKDYNKYIAFRNAYDKWTEERDRDNLEINVIGGESIPYDRNNSWDELFLPEDIKSNIKNCVDGFLASKEIYSRKNIIWKRGMLFIGPPGCGKTSCIKTIISNYNLKPVTVNSSSSTNDEIVSEAFSYAQAQGPSLLYFEDLDTLLRTSVTLSHFLNLMDGVNSKSGILVIATAYNPELLGEAVFDRPSRFDRKIEFPLPDKKMILSYLKKWFGENDKLINSIVKKINGKKFSYAYIKEIYLTSVYFALSDGREEPNDKDISKAINQVIYDKDRAQNGFEDDNENEEIGIRK